MTRKHFTACLAAAALVLAAAGCVSTQTSSEVTPHTLRVVDAVTKLPVVGADVRLSAPGMTMGHRTDERGMIDVGAYAFSSTPKPEELEVTKPGYGRVSCPLTNGLPGTVEIMPVPSQK